MKEQKANGSIFAVAYCRYSSLAQNEQSIEAQEIAIKKYAKDEGIIIKEWYVDEAYSATNDKRPAFKRMIIDSKEKSFSLILVYKLDRFSRDISQSAVYKQQLRKYGVRVFSVVERIENTPEGKFMENMYETMNEFYVYNLARGVLNGMKVNADKAKFNGGRPPYGYKIVPRTDEYGNVEMSNKKDRAYHKLVIDPEKAEAIKIMFNMTLEGCKRSDIIDRLNQFGL